MMDRVRRDVDKDIVDMMGDSDDRVNMEEWWDVLGFEGDITMRETLRMRVVGQDRLHLTERANRCAIASLCVRYRYRGKEESWTETGFRKKRRMH